MSTWLIVTGAVLMVVGAWSWWRRRAADLRLHRTLAGQSGLSAAETAWLWRRARRAHLADRAQVFVRPSLFEGRHDDAAMAAAVREKLFGQ